MSCRGLRRRTGEGIREGRRKAKAQVRAEAQMWAKARLPSGHALSWVAGGPVLGCMRAGGPRWRPCLGSHLYTALGSECARVQGRQRGLFQALICQAPARGHLLQRASCSFSQHSPSQWKRNDHKKHRTSNSPLKCFSKYRCVGPCPYLLNCNLQGRGPGMCIFKSVF